MSRRVLSFKFAFEGLWTAFMEEPNMRFHFLAAVVVIILGFLLGITLTEWLILILTIGLVISVELTNTAIETVVDSFTENTHPGAKRAKDVSAAAVLSVSIMAGIIGLVIFLPKIL